MMNKKLVFLIVVCLLVTGQVYAGKDKYKGKKEYSKERHVKSHRHGYKISEELDLTDKQKEKLREQRHKKNKERMETKNELRLKLHDIKYELSEKKIEQKKINKIVNEIGELEKKMIQNKVESIMEFRNTLTDEQWEKLREHKLRGMFGGLERRK